MTPNELYNSECVEETKSLEYLLSSRAYNLVPEIEEVCDLYYTKDYLEALSKNDRITIKIYGLMNMDSRRYWVVFGVFLDGLPVMVCQRAGREGDDVVNRYVTDVALYKNTIEYIRELIPTKFEELEIVDPDQPFKEDITYFYGQRIKLGQNSCHYSY